MKYLIITFSLLLPAVLGTFIQFNSRDPLATWIWDTIFLDQDKMPDRPTEGYIKIELQKDLLPNGKKRTRVPDPPTPVKVESELYTVNTDDLKTHFNIVKLNADDPGSVKVIDYVVKELKQKPNSRPALVLSSLSYKNVEQPVVNVGPPKLVKSHGIFSTGEILIDKKPLRTVATSYGSSSEGTNPQEVADILSTYGYLTEKEPHVISLSNYQEPVKPQKKVKINYKPQGKTEIVSLSDVMKGKEISDNIRGKLDAYLSSLAEYKNKKKTKQDYNSIRDYDLVLPPDVSQLPLENIDQTPLITFSYETDDFESSLNSIRPILSNYDSSLSSGLDLPSPSDFNSSVSDFPPYNTGALSTFSTNSEYSDSFSPLDNINTERHPETTSFFDFPSTFNENSLYNVDNTNVNQIGNTYTQDDDYRVNDNQEYFSALNNDYSNSNENSDVLINEAVMVPHQPLDHRPLGGSLTKVHQNLFNINTNEEVRDYSSPEVDDSGVGYGFFNTENSEEHYESSRITLEEFWKLFASELANSDSVSPPSPPASYSNYPGSNPRIQIYGAPLVKSFVVSHKEMVHNTNTYGQRLNQNTNQQSHSNSNGSLYDDLNEYLSSLGNNDFIEKRDTNQVNVSIKEAFRRLSPADQARVHDVIKKLNANRHFK